MKNLFYFLALTISIQISAQTGNPPGLKLIREADLKKDLYALADAHFSGRSAGTLDELKASAWLAEQFNAIGLKPAGDDGTYFQFFTLLRKQLATNSSILITISLFNYGTKLPYHKWRIVISMHQLST